MTEEDKKIIIKVIIFTLALSCTHLSGQQRGEAPDTIETPVCPTCPVCPVCQEPPKPQIRDRTRIIQTCSKLGPPPEPPKVNWAPPGCPTRKFGACLTTEDSALLLKYLQTQSSFNDNARRCSGQP